MLDFLMVRSEIKEKKKIINIFPSFIIKSDTTDLMIRGGDFYAIYNEDTGLWSMNEGDVVTQVDRELDEYKKQVDKRENVTLNPNDKHKIKVSYMWDSDSGSIAKWHKYVQKDMRDTYHQLDEKIIFSNTNVVKEDYASKRVGYPLEPGDYSAYDELMSVLYTPEERAKIEWAIGSVIAGDSKEIQKFVVLYGSGGTGKSTVLKIIEQLFEGYKSAFSAKELVSSSNAFSLESFKYNPLVGIDHEGDLSKIADNTTLNSVVSHEVMEINEKHKSKYNAKFNTFLFIATNKPVKIPEAKSGLIRRLIDVRPTGNKLPYNKYVELKERIKFELGGIAYHCLEVYKSMGIDYYDAYIPKEMMADTNDFYDFIENYYDDFASSRYITLKDVWVMYKSYCDYANITFRYSLQMVRRELKNYYEGYKDQMVINGRHYRNIYFDFKKEKFMIPTLGGTVEKSYSGWIDLKEQKSLLDEEYSDCPAQLAKENGSPKMKWDKVKSVLADIDTSLLHWVRPPINHIVIDFDLKDSNGNKSLELNLEAANKWPKTYVESSKSGEGLHLHYFYSGDVSKLKKIYDKDIEIKVFNGNSSLRRKLTKCNDIPIVTLNTGLPTKGDKKMLNQEAFKSEKALRVFVKNCLLKKHHGVTKPEIDYLKNKLEEVYNSGMSYDISDMKRDIIAFANASTNQATYCLEVANNLPYRSDEPPSPIAEIDSDVLVFFDTEIFPNLFVVVYKPAGTDGKPVVMINPKPADIAELCQHKLVGFNCRRYDNHVLYAWMTGDYNNYELFRLSQAIINKSQKNPFFGPAYNLSYTDVLDFSSEKKSLKKFEIELGIHHQELGLPWDEDVPEELWDKVAEYCINDVVATEAVFNARHGDFLAREILAEIAGMTVNDTTNALTTKIIFGNDKNPELVYTDLSETFPGYEMTKDDKLKDHNMYKGIDVGFGGFVYAEPGIYQNVALLDVQSMHPTSTILLNYLGEYTPNYKALLDARLAIKHGDYETAKKMFDGRLAPYLESKEDAKALSYALKIAINSVYGLTSAGFQNPFRHPDNRNNIVALRGALFMVDLKEMVEKEGFTVAHIKTDSIKIPNATKEIIDKVMDFGKKYGYTFEHEATYERMCLVNNAVYIARVGEEDGEKVEPYWTATGTQFQVPYVFKTLFSKEPIEFKDLCETKSVTTALYLDMNEKLKEDEHDYHFVGRVGSFCPIKEGCGGGLLMREKDGSYHAATGTKGYRWLESEMVSTLKKEEDIDRSYYDSLVEDAIEAISKFGDFDAFVNMPDDEQLPF